MKLSIVTTLYNTSDFLSDFLIRSRTLAANLTIKEFEFIIVDDGSTESQFMMAKTLCKNFSNTTLVRLSRNFGHHQALLEALKHSTGDIIFLIDSDLEEDPLDGKILFDEYQNANLDLVYGYQEKRRGNIWELTSGTLFYFVMRKLMRFNIPKNMLTSRIMSRRYVDALLSHTETQINFSGLSLITGFNQSGMPLKKIRHRKSSYSLLKKISILTDAITSFSSNPLKLIFGVGVLIFIASTLIILFLTIQWVYVGHPTSGWASLILSIWFLGGLILLSLGIIGIYISKIFMETKKRPRTITSEIFRYNTL